MRRTDPMTLKTVAFVLATTALATACGARSVVRPGDELGDGSTLATDAATDAPATGTTDAQTQPPQSVVMYQRGIYIVPPRSAVTTYDTPEVHWAIHGDRALLAYNLPRMLVGERIDVTLVGTVSPDRTRATLAGPGGTATCELRPSDGALVRCDERFVGLTVDYERVRELAQRNDPANVQARLDVTQRFIADPIGILEITGDLPLPTGSRVCTVSAPDCDTGHVCDPVGDGLGLCHAPDPD